MYRKTTCKGCGVSVLSPSGVLVCSCGHKTSGTLRPPIKTVKFGDILHQTIPGVFGKEKCPRCQRWIERLNRWSLPKCIEHKDQVVNAMVQSAKARPFLRLFGPINKPVASYYFDKAVKVAKDEQSPPKNIYHQPRKTTRQVGYNIRELSDNFRQA